MDPSLCNWGLSKGTIDVQTQEVSFEDILLVCTQKDEGGKKIRVSSDDLYRSGELFGSVYQYCKQHQVDILFAEVPVGSQSASGMKNYGICCGVLAALRSSLSVPLIEVSPRDLKVFIGGNSTTSKNQIIDWAKDKYNHLPWLRAKAKNEHMADSIAALHTGMTKQQWRDYAAVALSMRRHS